MNVPSFLLSIALSAVSSSVKSRAHFDLDDLSPIDHVAKTYIPALFATGTEDDFIEPQHCYDLHKKYAGDKDIITFEGGHNDERPENFFESV